jgi:hypothetical protein
MEEEMLEKYLPHEGDRIAVRSYAVRCSESESQHAKKKKEHDIKTSQDNKMALLGKLSQGMKFVSQNTIESESASSTASCSTASVFERLRSKTKLLSNMRKSKPRSNCNAAKETMAVDVGLSLFTSNLSIFKQVRSNKCGGIRSIRLPKLVQKKEIIDEAISAFFPKENTNDSEAKKYLFDLASDVCSLHLFREDDTAEGFMLRLKLKKMRCYLLAVRKYIEEVQVRSNNGFVIRLLRLAKLLSLSALMQLTHSLHFTSPSAFMHVTHSLNFTSPSAFMHLTHSLDLTSFSALSFETASVENGIT